MVERRLEGKVALITGAAGGIGASAARAFLAEGAALALTDGDGDRVEQLAQELGSGVHAHRHDVTSEEHWQEVTEWAVERHGRVDVLVNNAGVFLAAPLLDTAPEQFRLVLDVNLTGTFLGMRALAPSCPSGARAPSSTCRPSPG